MKRIHYILLLMFLFLLSFSCGRKNKSITENEGILLVENIKRNELYIHLDTLIKMFFLNEVDSVKDFYIIFKKTKSNDTLYQFSCFEINDKVLKNPDYKGFLKIDSLNVAVYDEEDIGLEWYKDSLQKKHFPNLRKYADKGKSEFLFDEKGEKVYKMHIVCMGWIKHGAFEELPSTKLAQNEWFKYFD